MARRNEKGLRPLKIIRVVPLLDFGGVEQRLKHTVTGFDQLPDYEISIVVLGNKGRASEEIQVLGNKPVHFNESIKIPNFQLIYRLYHFFKRTKPDVVHTSASEANFHGLIAATLARVPIRIGEEIGFPNHDWKWKIIFKWVYSLATKVIAISESVKNRIIELGEVKKEKVEVVYNPVSIKEFGEAQPLDDNQAFVFVTTCRLVPVKNLDLLIQVFDRLLKEHQNLKLWIIGEGPERLTLESQVKQLGIESNITFWGFQRDVIPFLIQANAFVLPSLSEGFSISLVEAMLCGLPCIVTNQGGPTEIVDHGKTGFLIDPLNQDQIRDTMNTVLNLSNDQRQTIGFSAKQAAQKYSVSNYINRLLEVYEDSK